jgi:hypothetical protein
LFALLIVLAIRKEEEEEVFFVGGIEGIVSAWRYTVMTPNMPTVRNRTKTEKMGL